MSTYTGKLLRVNITTGATAVEPIPEQVLRDFMGPRGIGLKYLYHELNLEKGYIPIDLPYIKHRGCPRNGDHENTVVDMSGKVRCSNKNYLFFKPGFYDEYEEKFDSLARVSTIKYHEISLDNFLETEEHYYPDVK